MKHFINGIASSSNWTFCHRTTANVCTQYFLKYYLAVDHSNVITIRVPTYTVYLYIPRVRYLYTQERHTCGFRVTTGMTILYVLRRTGWFCSHRRTSIYTLSIKYIIMNIFQYIFVLHRAQNDRKKILSTFLCIFCIRAYPQ